MKHALQRKPSASLVISLVALVVAASGTAVAASTLVKGDKLIAKHSLSGNRLNKHTITGDRLKNHTITGTQVNLSKLGKVPSAKKADFATSAGSATTATNATQLGGLGPSEYKTASNYMQNSTANPITATAETIGSPIQITTQSTRRVIATAAVHATNGVAGTGVYLVCHITIDRTSGVNDTDYASPAGGFTIVDASVSPMASAVVGAGTHTVTLLCSAAGGASPSATVVDDALAGWAVSE